MTKLKVTLVFPCGYEQVLDYDINRCGIKGRKHNGSRPIKAIVDGYISERLVKSLSMVLHPVHGEIVYV